jgi:hypothetical protein
VQTDGAERPSGRERSWDFCFNHFQAHPEPTRDLELSCLHLGYYLASWGMLRGRSYLARETNAAHYKATIQVIEDSNRTLRGIDASDYQDPDVRASILTTYRKLASTLLPAGGASETLVTKVMLGVWGVIPASDRYLQSTFRYLGETRKEQSAFNLPRERSLQILADFYTQHADGIDALASKHCTTNFATGQRTERLVPRMKIIDMFAFQAGFDGPSKALVLPL